MNSDNITSTTAAFAAKRRSSRRSWIRPVIAVTEEGIAYLGHSTVLSLSGTNIRVPVQLKKGQKIHLYVLIDGIWEKVDSRVIYSNSIMDFRFADLFDTGFSFMDQSAGSQLWLKGKPGRHGSIPALQNSAEST